MNEPRTVVVVDDDRVLRRFVARGLDEHDLLEVVERLTDEQSVVAEVLRRRPDVIVLDHQTPDGEALRVLPELRAACPGVRIVLWSASADATEAALALGIDATVSKDEPMAALLSAVLA